MRRPEGPSAVDGPGTSRVGHGDEHGHARPATLLSLRDVAFAYPGQAPSIQGLDLDLAVGEIHCLVGRSGCGKTTLLKLAAGLLRPLTGTVTLQASEPGAAGTVGFVLQQPTLLDWLTVLDNVLLPVSLQRRPTPQDRRAGATLLGRLGLDAHRDRFPRQLSGGQQSRAALARALLLEPPLLLLDEPFASLDAITREELQRELLRLCRERGIAALFVTHDIAEAVFLGDRVSVLARGRLLRTLSVPADATRDAAPFGACCAALREALEREGTAASTEGTAASTEGTAASTEGATA